MLDLAITGNIYGLEIERKSAIFKIVHCAFYFMRNHKQDLDPKKTRNLNLKLRFLLRSESASYFVLCSFLKLTLFSF
jgi:hypothetical protein